MFCIYLESLSNSQILRHLLKNEGELMLIRIRKRVTTAAALSGVATRPVVANVEGTSD